MGKGQVCPSCSEMLSPGILATLQGTISRPRGQLPIKSSCPLGQFSFYSAFKILFKKKKSCSKVSSCGKLSLMILTCYLFSLGAFLSTWVQESILMCNSGLMYTHSTSESWRGL